MNNYSKLICNIEEKIKNFSNKISKEIFAVERRLKKICSFNHNGVKNKREKGRKIINFNFFESANSLKSSIFEP